MTLSQTPPVDRHEQISHLIARKRDYRRETRALTEKYKYVVFYGCGAIFASIVETWDKQIHRNIDFCCDSDPAKWGKYFCGVKCLSPLELEAIKHECTIFVTIGDFRPVYNTLKHRGYPSVFQLFKYDLEAADHLPDYQAQELLSHLCDVRAMLGDEQSIKVFDAIVNRVLGDGQEIDVMLNVCEHHQYFPLGLIQPSDAERLVDIGAYNGDTVRDFVKRTHGHFGRVFSFELDAINFKSLKENVQLMPERDSIEIFNLGIWDSEQDISYSIGKSQSTVGSGEGKGHVVPLDHVLGHEKITMIKMDIEGAEPHGLRGAKAIIQAQKPKLAICIYHDFRHLWEIPLYIKSLVPEYKIYLRHHTNLEYETVCYAMA